MTTNPIIQVENLSKSYFIKHQQAQRYTALRDVMTDGVKQLSHRLLGRPTNGVHNPAKEEFWALDDVSFSVQQGERVGIIGRNGAGKSTLLKILSRITEPTKGRVRLRGRVASLLEVGTGFHPELTGRENIYLNGAILGMSRAEIKRKFDEIVAFAEVEKFLDTPVKRYSSGMYVRLAFAVAAHLEPEILVVDEVLAVGDVQFQQKCLGKMGEVANEGRTVLFVSHNMAAVEALCQRAIVLHQGQITFEGAPNQAIGYYVDFINASTSVPLQARQDREGNGKLHFTNVNFYTQRGEMTDTFIMGEKSIIQIEYQAESALSNVSISVPFFDQLGQSVFMAWTNILGRDFSHLPPQGKIIIEIPRLPLRTGSYNINLWCEVNGYLADWIKWAATFSVIESDFFGTGKLPPDGHGMVVVDHEMRYEAL